MEDKGRPFESVKIGLAAVETGEERFGSDENAHLPLRAAWRLNLTALSQQYNLYFMASAHEVHVYEPQFPFQKLGRDPKLVLIPQLANYNAPGYIDPSHPHCINHLIVDNLGDQEILLFATDSGNVTAYETRVILNALRENASADNNDSAVQNYGDIRPFFMQCIDESAWGLSIHSEARMIAVSYNTPAFRSRSARDVEERATIAVFAFALDSSTTDDQKSDASMVMSTDLVDGEPEWHIWNASKLNADSTIPDRTKNFKILLAGLEGHSSNIPCITFVNCRDDQHGSWLLSTDINEDVKLWQIWNGRCERTWRFKDPTVSGAAWLGGRELGWIVAAIDRQAFQRVADMGSFIGHSRAPQYYGHASQGSSFDITNVVRYHVPSNSLIHPSNDDADNIESSDEDDIQIFEDLTDSDSTADEADLARIERIQSELQATTLLSDPLPHGYPTANSGTSLVGFDNVDTASLSEESSVDSLEFDIEVDANLWTELLTDPAARYSPDLGTDANHDVEYSMHPSSLHASTEGPRGEHTSQQSHISSNSGDNRGTRVDVQTDHARQKVAISPTRVESSHRSTRRVPDIPFVFCSTSHLRLFSGLAARSPHLFCGRMLKQTMEEGMMMPMDRLDMAHQIPELGILIIATQAGRCAICALTRREEDDLVGLRVDWILPTKKEERAGKRPYTVLQGIAVSPIQGRQRFVPSLQDERIMERMTKDRIVDGISTTFDRQMVDLSHIDMSNRSLSQTGQNFPARAAEPRAIEHAADSSSPQTNLFPPNMKKYNWSKARTLDPRIAADGSRRYRLMLTYADMTVMTYELYRGVERDATDVR